MNILILFTKIWCQFIKKNNIEQIKSINKKLDPNLHQAMMEIEDDTKEPGTVSTRNSKGIYDER